jgi:hypothetical protein
MMPPFGDFEHFAQFRAAWESVRVERPVEYSLFTFGDSELAYFLVTSASEKGGLVRVRQGQVKISRARIITPENMHPELQNFFEDEESLQFVQYLMARTAAFSSLKLSNTAGPDRIVTDTVEEAVAKLNRQLDDEEEDRVAILSAPAALAGFALFRYASEKILSSAPGNFQELRDRGFLPGL